VLSDRRQSLGMVIIGSRYWSKLPWRTSGGGRRVVVAVRSHGDGRYSTANERLSWAAAHVPVTESCPKSRQSTTNDSRVVEIIYIVSSVDVAANRAISRSPGKVRAAKTASRARPRDYPRNPRSGNLSCTRRRARLEPSDGRDLIMWGGDTGRCPSSRV
jgi:hypothetical protein